MPSKLPSIKEIFGGLKNNFQTKVAPLKNNFTAQPSMGNGFWATPMAQKLANVQRYIENPNTPLTHPIPEISPFRQRNVFQGSGSGAKIGNTAVNLPGQVGNLVANIPGGIFNSIIGKGVVAPTLDITQNVGKMVGGKDLTPYEQLHSGASRLGYQIAGTKSPEATRTLGIKQGPKQTLGNIASTADPLLNTYLLTTGAGNVAVKGAAEKTLWNAIKSGAFQGAKYGTAFGTVGGLESGRNIESDPEYALNLFTNILGGTAGGAVLGGTMAGVSGFIANVIRGFKPKASNAEIYTDVNGYIRNRLGRFAGQLVGKEPIQTEVAGGGIMSKGKLVKVAPNKYVTESKVPEYYKQIDEKLGIPKDFDIRKINLGNSVKPLTAKEHNANVSKAGLGEITLPNTKLKVPIKTETKVSESQLPKFPNQTIKTGEDIEKILAKHEIETRFAKPPEISKQESNVKLTEAIIGDENNQFRGVFNKWIGQRDVAKTTGAEAGIDFTNISKKNAEEFINHAEGVKPSKNPEIAARATEWKQKTDTLYTDLKAVAKKEGADLGYIDTYVTHFWKETPEQVQKIMSAKGRGFGSRSVPTYAEGIKLGLTPKYSNPAEIMSEYVTRIEKTKANINLYKEMSERALIVPSSIGRNTPGFSPINAPGFPRSSSSYQGKVFEGSYYAPTSIAGEINKIFSPEDFGKTGQILSRTAKVSKGTQDIVLSGGVPKTPVNAFTVAQVVKEFTSGSFVRPFKALATSLSPTRAQNYFKANAGQIKKMQARNVTVRSTFETNGLMGGGSKWDSLISTPTFKRFMPTLQVEFFNNIEKRAIRSGKSANEAADIAAKAVQNFYGLTNTGDLARRSQLSKDITSTFAFAPTYRESMINFWIKSVKALRHPLALENSQNIKFLMGAAITYGIMDGLNRQLNGHPMSQNPKGKEDKLLIPAGDSTIGVPFLSSIATVPRGIYRIAKDVLDIDFKAAGADTLRTFGSMLIKPAGEMILNEDYFGREIVDPNATPIEKGKQIALYLFKSNNHPYVKAAMEAKGTPIYQTLSKAMELPFRFYKSSSIANAPFWDKYFAVKAKDEQFQELKYKDPDKAVQFYNENKADLDSLDSLKDQVKAYYETGEDSKVLQDGGVVQADGHMAFKGTDGEFHLIDTNFDVPLPEYTGNALLDKKIKSSYISKLTALEKNVVILFENGIITADEAEEALSGIGDLKTSAGGGKKPKKLTLPKLTAPKLTPTKYRSTLGGFKLSDIKIPDIQNQGLNLSKSSYTLRATPRIKIPARLQSR